VSFAKLAAALAEARKAARLLDPAPWTPLVASIADAYAVQSELARLDGGVRGWKVSALTPEQQRPFGTDKPVAGALLAPFVDQTPAQLSLARFVTPLLECEIAFLLGADLPARAAPYTRPEIEAAVDAVVPAMEIADSRLPSDAPDILKAADVVGNGAFIAGRPMRDRRKLDLSDIDITLSHEGKSVGRGSSTRILGNPLLAVVALANAQPLPAGGLRKGQIVTTGTCIIPVPLRTGAYVGDFGPLGNVVLEVV
jgi:2-keto-4-pentenoate hydratase